MEDVDLKAGIITIQRAMLFNSQGAGWYFKEPKTPQSRRSIPIPRHLASQLKHHRTKQLEQRMKAGDMLVHPDGTGTKVVSKIKTFFAYRRYSYAVVWSPDGKHLLLNAWRGEYGAIEVTLLDLNTGRSQAKTKNGLAAFGWVSQ